MAWLARDKKRSLYVYQFLPTKDEKNGEWIPDTLSNGETTPCVILPSDSDEKLIGRHISFEDGPICIGMK